MNRAQRRASGKPQREGFNPAFAALAQRQAILTARTEDVTPEIRTTLMLPAYEALESLVHGRAEDEDFIRLTKYNLFGSELSVRLEQHGNAKEQFTAVRPAFLAAGAHLAAVGARKTRTDRYGATGDELGAIRESIRLLGELLEVAPQGHAILALQQADKLTRAKLRTLR
jgi:hypothetical protein